MSDADESFALIGAAMSKDVFNNTPVDVIYTDDYFKDIKTIPYKPSALSAVNISDQVKEMNKKTSNNNTLYYSKDIPGEQADSISDYLVKSGFFSSVETEISYTRKINEKKIFLQLIIRFPVICPALVYYYYIYITYSE